MTNANESELQCVGDISRHPWTENRTISGSAEAARAYLEVGAAGLPCAELAVELAQAVLRHPDVQLALQVLEGGPFARARATQLACRVLAVSTWSSPLSALRRSLQFGSLTHSCGWQRKNASRPGTRRTESANP